MIQLFARCTLLLVILLCTPAVQADGTAENEKFRVMLDASETVAQGFTWEFVLTVENLSDRTIKVRSQACMKTPFGPLCGPVPSPKKIDPGAGVEVAALMICEPDTPLGDYQVLVSVRSGNETLTIPHSITVVPPPPE